MNALVIYKMYRNFLQGIEQSLDWLVGIFRNRRWKANETTTKKPKITIWIRSPAKARWEPSFVDDGLLLAMSPPPI